MAYGKRSPLPKLKNANAIDDVKSALQKKDIKITGAMGSELRAKQYKEKGWAMDNTIGSAQGGSYKKPTTPTGKFGSDLRKKEYEANNWGGDATTKGNMPGSKSTKTNTGGGVNTGGGTNTGGGNKLQSLQSIVDSGKYKVDENNQLNTAADSLIATLEGKASGKYDFKTKTAATKDYKFGSTFSGPGYEETARKNIGKKMKEASESSGSTGEFDFQNSNSNMMNATNNNDTNAVNTNTGTGTEKPKNLLQEYVKNNRKPQSTPKYSTEGKSGKQLRRTNRANKYNDLARKAFESGNTLEAQRLSLEERGISKRIKRTASIREKRRARKLEKAQAKVKKYTK